MMKKVGILICITLFPVVIAGKCRSSQERPAWVDGFFQEESNSYIEVVSAVGNDEENARNKAAAIIVERRSLGTGSRMNVTVKNGIVLVDGQDAVTVKSRVIDEYREKCGANEYRVYLLMQTARNPTYEYERVKVTKDYGFLPQAFIPGMAQIHKGSTVKGICFIVGEIVLVSGVILYKSMDKAEKQDTGYYDAGANIASNILIAGAVGIYVWNVIDGLYAKGNKHVVIGDNQLRVTPFLAPEMNGAGLTLSMNF